MAKTKVLSKRRKSIRSIRKITRTMELISTASYRRAMDRAISARAYTERMATMVQHLAQTGAEVSHPLLEAHPSTENVTLMVLTSNRGLCGGYNSGLVRAALARWNQMTDENSPEKIPNVELQVSGKRGISFFNFRKIKPAVTYTQFEDKPAWEEIEQIGKDFLERYLTGKLDRLEIVYMKFESMSKQVVVRETLLPLSEIGRETEDSQAKDEKAASMYDFLPSAESILSEVVPASFKMKFFKCFLDAAVSEQIARMVAMKAATENADGMIKTLTMAVNRARQGQITGELTELIGGVEALK